MCVCDNFRTKIPETYVLDTFRHLKKLNSISGDKKEYIL